MTKFLRTLSLLLEFGKFARSIVDCIRSKDTKTTKTDYVQIVGKLNEVADIVNDPDNVATVREVATEIGSVVDKLKNMRK